MGVLGKDLFDWQRSHTHTKIQFGQSTYWIEDEPAAHHYGEVLVEVLNYDATVYLQACAALRKAFQTGDGEGVISGIRTLSELFSSLPLYHLYLSNVELEPMCQIGMDKAAAEYYLGEGHSQGDKYLRAAEDITLIQKRYAWFLEGAFQQTAFEKKKGQRKIPLTQQIYKNNLDAFVSGVSLCQSPEVDTPQVNIQYAILELDEDHHELVETLYFDRLADFVYVELMRGLQRGFVPKRCANCGRWFLQTPGASYNYCDQLAPNSEEGKTCREVGSTKSFRAKVLNHPVWAVHQRAYKKYFARTRTGAMTKAEFEIWGRKSERLRNEALEEYDRAGTPEERNAVVEKLTEELNRT